MDISLLKESRKILYKKFDKKEINKGDVVASFDDSKIETGRNIGVMSKIKRKKKFEFKGKERVIPNKKQTTFYIKRYTVDNKPYPKSVNGVLEYATYKICQYYKSISHTIKIPNAIHLSFEENDKQFTIASSVNFKDYKKTSSGFKTMIYSKIANKNIFFFSLIGYADTHVGNIVVKNEDSYYLIDFDYAFHAFGDKLLSYYGSQIIQNKDVKNSMLNSYILYKQINIQKVRTIISNAFKKAVKLLDNEKDKLDSKDYENISKELEDLQNKMVKNLYHNKKAADDFAKYYDFDKKILNLNRKKESVDYFDGHIFDKKNLPTTS